MLQQGYSCMLEEYNCMEILYTVNPYSYVGPLMLGRAHCRIHVHVAVEDQREITKNVK